MTVLEAGERHQELIDELIATVAAYNPDVDRDLLARAFRFAANAHEGQQRRSGEDFINHPWGAAKICAELRLDEQTIAAALLHDVVEDTGTDIKEVRDEFGDEIAQLVEGVTKLTRIQFQSREQAEAENYRKMIVAMAQDVRVILIKLADRLHNMRTIEYLGKQKQVQKAQGDARGLRAARPPARHQQDQVGARGPRLLDAAPAQVRGDQGDGQRAPRRPRGARPRGGDDAPARAREGGHPGRHLGPREALLLDLRQDGQEGPRVQRDLRPHGDAGDRRSATATRGPATATARSA